MCSIRLLDKPITVGTESVPANKATFKGKTAIPDYRTAMNSMQEHADAVEKAKMLRNKSFLPLLIAATVIPAVFAGCEKTEKDDPVQETQDTTDHGPNTIINIYVNINVSTVINITTVQDMSNTEIIDFLREYFLPILDSINNGIELNNRFWAEHRGDFRTLINILTQFGLTGDKIVDLLEALGLTVEQTNELIANGHADIKEKLDSLYNMNDTYWQHAISLLVNMEGETQGLHDFGQYIINWMSQHGTSDNAALQDMIDSLLSELVAFHRDANRNHNENMDVLNAMQARLDYYGSMMSANQNEIIELMERDQQMDSIYREDLANRLQNLFQATWERMDTMNATVFNLQHDFVNMCVNLEADLDSIKSLLQRANTLSQQGNNILTTIAEKDNLIYLALSALKDSVSPAILAKLQAILDKIDNGGHTCGSCDCDRIIELLEELVRGSLNDEGVIDDLDELDGMISSGAKSQKRSGTAWFGTDGNYIGMSDAVANYKSAQSARLYK